MRKNRKLKPLCAAVMGMLGAVSALPLHANPLNQYVATGPNATINVYVAGATALDIAVRDYMRYICGPGGTVDQFIFSGGVNQVSTGGTAADGGNVYTTDTVGQSMYFCTINGARVSDAALAGKTVLLRKSSGDSGEGVAAASDAMDVNFMASPTVTGTNTNYGCANVATSNIASDGTLAALNVNSCTTAPAPTPISAPQVIGLSDVEFSLLGPILTVNGDPVDPAGTTVKPTAANIWGFAITTAFRNALQAAQGKTVGSDTEANMPSLSRGTLTSILTGTIGDTRQFVTSDGTALPSLAGVTAPAVKNFYLSRRPVSSGTNTSIRVLMMSELCTANVAPLADQNIDTCGQDVADPGTNQAGQLVSIHQSSSLLLGCLATLNTANKWGLGFSSTTAPQTAGWKWVKVDGATPSLLNAATGHYNLFTEGVLGYKGTGPTGLAGNFTAEMAKGLAQPATLSGIDNAAKQAPDNWVGALAVPSVNAGSFSPPAPLTQANLLTTPVLPYTKSLGGPNACQPAQFTKGKQNVTVQ